jgi:hypothetical protein
MSTKIIGVIGEAGAGKDTVANMLASYHPVLGPQGWRDVARLIRDPNVFADPIAEGAVTLGFADPGKEFCQAVYGFSDEQLWGPSALRNVPDQRFPRRHKDGHSFARVEGDVFVCRHCDRHFDNADPVEGDEAICVSYLTPREALQQLCHEWARNRFDDTWVEALERRYKQTFYSYPVIVINDVRYENELVWIRENEGYVISVSGGPGKKLTGVFASHVSEQVASLTSAPSMISTTSSPRRTSPCVERNYAHASVHRTESLFDRALDARNGRLLGVFSRQQSSVADGVSRRARRRRADDGRS